LCPASPRGLLPWPLNCHRPFILTCHPPREPAFVAPSHSPVVKRRRLSISLRRNAPPQGIEIE
jgi:hypothetical protein